ncbi:hypothetical protein AGLY_001541 [Aphis glycines]|uniref:Uncharacterized protein n=1 Tax=Aphis glycines TaxID=307491 RepID=A0A6G0U7V5_APHGL|nr:hypothetical protein AGLY_001541 [Aphis glycines]
MHAMGFENDDYFIIFMLLKFPVLIFKIRKNKQKIKKKRKFLPKSNLIKLKNEEHFVQNSNAGQIYSRQQNFHLCIKGFTDFMALEMCSIIPQLKRNLILARSKGEVGSNHTMWLFQFPLKLFDKILKSVFCNLNLVYTVHPFLLYDLHAYLICRSGVLNRHRTRAKPTFVQYRTVHITSSLFIFSSRKNRLKRGQNNGGKNGVQP